MSRFGLVLALFVALAPATAHAGKAEEAKAAKLFDQAEAEYQGGNFKKAIELLLEAQRLAPDAVLHYNLARAYEGLGELDPALASYRAYLEADPSSKDRGAVEARIKTIEQLKADREAKQSPPPPPNPSPEPDKPKPEPTSPSPVPWVIAGIGALGLGAGGVLGGFSLMRTSEAEEPTTSGEDVVSLQDEAQTFATAANITFAISGAVLAAGVIWGIVDVVDAGDGNDSPTSLRIEITTGGARLVGVF
ncbi:MAG: tetratricopeptide repeat protein [Polyangiaceae bacterium]|nr:tetratricopeptide repeat protein [Polyangiaceae bacterium]